MPPEKHSPSETTPEFPTDPDALEKIYLKGFNAELEGKRREENPYPFSFGYKQDGFSPFVYSAKWENGRVDGRDVSKENPNLSEDQKRKKIEKLKKEFPNDPTIQNL